MFLIGRGRHLGNGCDFVFIWPVTTCGVCFTEKMHFLLLILQFFILQLHITFPSSFKQGCQCLIMITVAWLLTHYHDVINNYNHILHVPKALVQLALKYISCDCSSKRHHGISKSSKLSVKSCKKGKSFIKLLVPKAFLAIDTT